MSDQLAPSLSPDARLRKVNKTARDTPDQLQSILLDLVVLRQSLLTHLLLNPHPHLFPGLVDLPPNPLQLPLLLLLLMHQKAL